MRLPQWPGGSAGSDSGTAPGERAAQVTGMRRWRRLVGPRSRDVVAVALSAFATIIDAVERYSDGVGVFALVVVFGTLGTVALWWRRRHPVLIGVLGVLVVVLSGNPMPICFALVRIATVARNRLLVVAMVLTALALSAPQVGAADRFGYGTLLGGAFAVAFLSLWGAYVGARRDLLASLQDRAERAEAERELRSDQARLAERSRIAGEMHDVLAHKVSLIALQAGALEVNADAPPAVIEHSAALIRTTARQAMEDLREVLGLLRAVQGGDEVAPQPDLSHLHLLIGSSRAAGVAVSYRIAIDGVVPAQVGRTVYRVVQEALTNAHKHARGAVIDVEVLQTGAVVTVAVTNAAPVSAEGLLPGSGFGLVGLRERVTVLGGTLHAGRNHSGGWAVTATIPLSPPPGAATPQLRDAVSRR